MSQAFRFVQNDNVPICTSTYTIGFSRQCDFSIKDHTISGTLCKIRLKQVYLKIYILYAFLNLAKLKQR